MKSFAIKFGIVLTILLLAGLVSCKKDTPKVEPKVVLTNTANITSNSATAGGTVSADGGAPVTARGFCWSSTNATPSTSDSKTTDGTGTGSFSGSLSSLTQGTTYTIRAYATNSVGTGYSSTTSFNTLVLTPTLTTTDLTAVTSTSYNSGGNITNDGGSPVTAKGVCWSVNQYPTISNSKTSDGTGTGTFSSSITNLVPGATYYFRAYASNSGGTAYGNQISITTTSVWPGEYTIRPDKANTSPVSNKLMGFNLVYAVEPDAIWTDGIIAGCLKDVNVAFLRYPGGAVTTYYHWNALTGNGWIDSWNPTNTGSLKNSNQYMDIDEYMALVKVTGATPLLGINMSSGWQYNRQNDGINEGLSLMKYCKSKNFKVDYWYLDNEPWLNNYLTLEEYASLINTYAPVMKAFDPNIKIVVNWAGAFKYSRSAWDKLFKLAGANIDVIDVHYYWGVVSWVNWLSSTPMGLSSDYSYIDDIKYFHQMVKEFGYPNTKLASFEWNSVSNQESDMTTSRLAILQSEMLMQFIIGGIDFAVFWPLHWPSAPNNIGGMVNTNNNSINPNYNLFRFIGKMQGGKLLGVETITMKNNMLTVAVQDNDQTALRICILNKNDKDLVTGIQMDQFPDLHFKEAQMYTISPNGGSYTLENVTLLKSIQSDQIEFLSKSVSLTMLVFEK